MLQRFRRLFGVPRDRVWEGESNIRGKSVDRYANVEIAGQWVWGRTRMQLATQIPRSTRLDVVSRGKRNGFSWQDMGRSPLRYHHHIRWLGLL